MSSIVEEILPIGKELNVAYTQRVVGKDNRPYVVFVHGFGSNKESWIEMMDYFEERYRVITPDIPGFGENDFIDCNFICLNLILSFKLSATSQ